MNQVLFMLKTIPEYAALIQALNQGQSAAVTVFPSSFRRI